MLSIKPSTTVFTHNTPPAAPNGEHAKHQTALKSSLLGIRPVFLPHELVGKELHAGSIIECISLIFAELKDYSQST